MSQTILIEKHPEFNKLYNLNLSTYTGTDVINRENAQDAINLIKILPTINLIICPANIDDENTAEEIYAFLDAHKLDIPLIVLGENKRLPEDVLRLETPVEWEVLVKYAGKLLGVTDEQLSQRIQPNYIPISLTYFYDISHTPCDVYIRIKKKSSEYQFVKRIHAQENLEKEEVDKYAEQGLTDLYIHKDYQQYFVTFVTNSIISKLEKELAIIERLATNSNAFEIVKEHIIAVGVSKEISDLAESAIQSMIEAIKSAPKMAQLLRMLFSSKISYAYQKSHLTCAFGNFILKQQNWYQERYLTQFAYLCFFADITLRSPKLMAINSNDDLEAAKLDADERHEVLVHAKSASEIVTEIDTELGGTSELVLHQHGQPNGVGFPDRPSTEIEPLAKIFIVADAFVKILLDNHSPKNKKDILTILYMQFQDAHYQKIIRFLEQQID